MDMKDKGVNVVVKEEISSDCSSDNENLQESIDVSPLEENHLLSNWVKCENNYETARGGTQTHTEKKLFHKDIKMEAETVEITKIKEEVEDIEIDEHQLQIKFETEDRDVEWDHMYAIQLQDEDDIENWNNYNHLFVKEETEEGMYVYIKFLTNYCILKNSRFSPVLTYVRSLKYVIMMVKYLMFADDTVLILYAENAEDL